MDKYDMKIKSMKIPKKQMRIRAMRWMKKNPVGEIKGPVESIKPTK